MKNILFLTIMSIFLFGACTENPPVIPALGGGVESERKVLVEEFTGVRCVNCPDGSAEIQNLIALHGENVIAISIHSGYFSTPYPENQYDFQTEDGDALTDLLGEPAGFPSAVINRKIFAGENTRQVGKASWAGYIDSELGEAPKLNIGIVPTFDEATRLLEVTISVLPLENINEPLNLSVMLTEDNIVDVQLLPTGKDPEYVHKHVFRKALTESAAGLDMGSSFTSGQSITKSFSMTIPTDWKADDCHVISFVHKNGPDYNVLQANEVKMK